MQTEGKNQNMYKIFQFGKSFDYIVVGKNELAVFCTFNLNIYHTIRIKHGRAYIPPSIGWHERGSSMKKIAIKLLLLAALAAAFGFSYAEDVTGELSDNLIRLHIVANSDSDYDQTLKLELKDSINRLIGEMVEGTDTKQKAEKIIQNALPEIEAFANRFLEEKKAPYSASAQYGHFDFPTKNYENVTLPSGTYDGLKINLGSAAGQNWWCVMFPPLCFTNDVLSYMPERSEAYLNDQLDEESFRIITTAGDDDITIHFKFKIVEIFENLKQSFHWE